MKNKIILTLTALVLSLLFANVGEAAFIVKKGAKYTVTAESSHTNSISSNTVAYTENMATKTETRKHSFFSNAVHFLTKGKKAAISKIGYIILAIFFLGWLGIGLIDNFEGYSWLLSLLLYILFWLPGFVYTLFMMHKYY